MNHNGGAVGWKTITVRPRQWERSSPTTVTLRQMRDSADDWDVHLADGTLIGTITRYTGSIDRAAGRLRIPGKRRTLWAYKRPGDRTSMWEQVSRADCIRQLVVEHERA